MPTINPWNSNKPAEVAMGGTGAATFTNNCLLVGTAAAAVRSVGAATAGYFCVGQGAAADPIFTNTSNSSFTFTRTTAGQTAYVQVNESDNTNPVSNALYYITTGGASGGDPYINFSITGAGQYSLGMDNSDSDKFKITASASPSGGSDLFTMTNAGVITLANALDVTEGGTGVTTFTSHGILMGNGTGDIQATAEMSDGQILIGRTATYPIPANISAGVGIAIVNGAGSITIASTGGGLTWTAIGANQSLAVNNGVICTGGANLELTLPAAAALGSMFEIVLDGSTSWKVVQGAGQQIRYGDQETTAGAGGYLLSTAQGDTIRFVCSVANSRFIVISSQGNITVN